MCFALLSSGCTGPGAEPSETASITASTTTLVSPNSPIQPPPEELWSQFVATPGDTGRITFGFPVCVQGSGRIVITGVVPQSVKGTGFTEEGVRLVSFRKGEGDTLATDGYPPAPRDSDMVQSIPGAVPTNCTDPEWTSEVQVGLATSGSNGGGWDGAIVTFSNEGGTQGSVVIPYRMLMCGHATDPC